MLMTRVMPCLLLDDGRLVKTIKFKSSRYVGDPINALKIYNGKEVDELILLDITATRQNRKPPFNIIEEVASECFMPVAYGGGIRNIEDMKKIFSLGIEKISINSYAAENPDFIKEAAYTFGSQSVIVSIDVKRNAFGKYRVMTHGGTQNTKYDPVKYAQMFESHGAGEIIINSINRDGTFEGYGINLLKSVTSAVSIPVIALGGAGCVNDIVRAVKEGGASAAAAGSLFVYQGKGLGVLINFPQREELEAGLKNG
ncbi:MAG: AglZ/HisF2 family acetamidino modification protein [candidate division Zixibacteria bacterium]